mmetsp:Transcript_3039/g.6402  ORF Transcript_3039/g.6402 Transcript_3039/m.6402 type:complete len:438 (+) Transcript_3039:156-1469(+)
MFLRSLPLRMSIRKRVLENVVTSTLSSQDVSGIGAWSEVKERPTVNSTVHPLPRKVIAREGDLFARGGSSDPLDAWHLRRSSEGLPSTSATASAADPFDLTSAEIRTLSAEMTSLLTSSHPVLAKCAQYFFTASSGKKVRPTMVILMSYALNPNQPPLPTPDADVLRQPTMEGGLLETQRRLAEITEMIHTASLFHDDVIDKSSVRRNMPSVNHQFGNKMAILAGDFLLARASVSLARLRDIEVVEVMSTVIEHLVKGEVMQMRVLSKDERGTDGVMEYYLKKNFYKTSSLMANSCMSAALLADCTPNQVKAAYEYGKHVGNAFQLIDDVLDFEGNVSTMGKPALADLHSGVTTAPVLYAAETYPEVYDMVERKFENPGDIDRAIELVNMTDGIERTRELARVHAEVACEGLYEAIGDSVYRDGLVNLARRVLERQN